MGVAAIECIAEFHGALVNLIFLTLYSISVRFL